MHCLDGSPGGAVFRSLNIYFSRLLRQGISTNVGTYVGSSQIWTYVRGEKAGPPTAEEVKQMQAQQFVLEFATPRAGKLEAVAEALEIRACDMNRRINEAVLAISRRAWRRRVSGGPAIVRRSASLTGGRTAFL